MPTLRFVAGPLALVLLAAPCFAGGPTFTVNSTKDLPDATPLGDGVVDADLNAAGDQITLRGAIMESNATFASNLINLPAGVFKLSRKTPKGESDSDANGDLDIVNELVITGAGADQTIIDAEKVKDRAFHVDGTLLLMSGVTIRKGKTKAGGSGGGILAENAAELVLSNSIISKCIARDDGGGVAIDEARLTVSDTLFLKNEAEDDGGGLDISSPPNIANVFRCTFSKNVAREEGGGLEVSEGDTLMSNCTLDGNKARDQGGGGVSYEGGGNHTWVSCTLARNKGAPGTGIREDVPEGGADSLTIVNTIMANGKTTNYAGDGIITGGHNIDTGTTCGFTGTGDLQSTNPLLAKTLKDNGGPTPTIALKPGSPAIDAADDANAPATDQRLVPRQDILGVGTSMADIGAYEFELM